MKFSILIFVVDRANYGRLFPLINFLDDDNRFDIKTCFTGTTILAEYGKITDEVSEDRVNVDFQIPGEVDGRNHQSMCYSIAVSYTHLTLPTICSV